MKFVVLLAVIMLALSAYGFKFMPKGITTRMVARHATSIAGETGTESYRLFFEDGGKRISPWHDIPLKAGDGLYNFVNEIPKYTKAKMEVATKEENNPIAQDIKKGKLRDYHGPIFWNYGMLPQTWEKPEPKSPSFWRDTFFAKGLDVVEETQAQEPTRGSPPRRHTGPGPRGRQASMAGVCRGPGGRGRHGPATVGSGGLRAAFSGWETVLQADDDSDRH